MDLTQEITAFETHISKYRHNLNEESSTLLFIATLGIYGIPSKLIQLFALILIMMIFTRRIYLSMTDKRTFPSIIESLQSKIDSIENQKNRIHPQYQLDRIKKLRLEGFTSYLRDGWIFMLTSIFFGITCLYIVTPQH